MNFLVLLFIDVIMKTLSIRTEHKNLFCLIISVFCVLTFVIHSETITENFIFSLKNSLNVIVPSVFPMLVITYFISGVGFSEKTKELIGKIIIPLFGLSGNSSEVLLTGLFGGYNTAVKSAEKKYSSGEISSEEAKRLTLFFTCPGLSFCVNICGISVYSDIKTGIIFLIGNILSCILSASFYNLIKRNKPEGNTPSKSREISSVFVESVASSVTAVIGIVSWISAFSVILTLISASFPFESLNTLLKLTAEVSSAVFFSGKNYSLAVTAFCLSFGGLCIFFQQLPDIIKIGLSPFCYLTSRLIQAVLCSVICNILFLFFPVSISVSANYPAFHVSKTSLPGSVALIILGIILINSIKTAKSEKTRQKTKNIYNK